MTTGGETEAERPVRRQQAPLHLFAIGNCDDPCFHSPMAWLEASAVVHRFATAEQASEALDRRPGQQIAAFVFFALRDGEVRSDHVERMHRREPFARLALLLGTWCEGDVRSGRVTSGVPRIYWHQWQGLLPHATGLWEWDAPLLPRTASDLDTLDSLLQRPSPSISLLVAVRVHRQATYNMLAEAILAGGHRSIWAPRDVGKMIEEPTVLLYEAWPETPDQLHTTKIRRVLLIDFPRWEDHLHAAAEGITLVSKPFQLAQLWAAIEGRAGGGEADMRGGCDDSLSPADWQNSLSQSAGSTKSQPTNQRLGD